jgi:hypothetical protein
MHAALAPKLVLQPVHLVLVLDAPTVSSSRFHNQGQHAPQQRICSVHHMLTVGVASKRSASPQLVDTDVLRFGKKTPCFFSPNGDGVHQTRQVLSGGHTSSFFTPLELEGIKRAKQLDATFYKRYAKELLLGSKVR